MTHIKKNHSEFQIFIFLFLLILTAYILEAKLIEPEYNNGNKQDPEIDESYSNSPGRSIYYITRGSYKTMYNFVLIPNETLEISFKMYTDSETLIGALENGYKIYFGFDFMVENLNETLKQYNTDIIVCVLDKKDVHCYDYVYDNENSKYIRNLNGTISSNYLIPFGFENLTLNLLSQNVIGYKNYYSVKFHKKFNTPYQNTTIYNLVKYLPNEILHKVIGFYGIVENEDDLIQFSPDIPEYYQKLLFENGAGLKPNTPDKVLPIITILKYGLLLYFTFIF